MEEQLASGLSKQPKINTRNLNEVQNLPKTGDAYLQM